MTTPVNDNTPLPDRWAEAFTDRELQHIEFCQLYESKFAHGAPNHLSMIVIARLAYMLERSYKDNDILAERLSDKVMDE